MIGKKVSSLVYSAVIVCCVPGVVSAEPGLVLEYDRPALHWDTEALPIGNGSLGGMIFGSVDYERIQFNEDSLWTGNDQQRGDYQAFGDILVGLTDGPIMLPQYAPYPRLLWNNNFEYSVDGDLETVWGERFRIDKTPVTWEAEYAESVCLSSYSVTSPSKWRGSGMPKSWEFQGSNDGKSWATLDRQEGDDLWTDSSQEKTFEFENSNGYSRYRLLFFPTVEPTPEQVKRKWHPERFHVAEIRLGNAAHQKYSNYTRSLDIENSTHTVTYESNGVQFKREYFCSYPDGVMVMRLSADKPGQYSGVVMLKDAHGVDAVAEGSRILFSGALEDNGLKYEALLRVVNDGGKLVARDGKMIFDNANGLTLILTAGTEYVPDMTMNWRGEHPHKRLTQNIDRAVDKGYANLLASHVRDYQGVFNRVEFLLEGAHADKGVMTDARHEAYKQGGKDLFLERLLFHMGRYLLISSSRPGALPANLQGLWNNRWVPTWGSDYHSNINIQMSYWPAQTANMHDLHMQYVDYILSQIPAYGERLREAFEGGTKNQKGEARWKTLPRGWTMRTNGNIFGATGFRWCETANAWHMQHFWEQYAFTQDKAYLAKIAYPAMKEVCEYWEDRLKERPDGTLVVPDGWSPEHGDEEDGVTYDQMFVWDLFNNFVEASDELVIDSEYRDKIADMRDRLLAPKIGSWGQLQEWEEDKDDPNDTHRHFSHMVGLHPGRQITPRTTPELAEACRVTLKAKEKAMSEHPKFPDFWKLTGWSKAWRISMWARLYESQRAHNIARELISYRIYPNMMSTCPPICLDASWGYTAGVCEMLLQSHRKEGGAYELDVLPALPEEWPTGRVTGLTARGAFEVDIDWADMKARGIRIKSSAGKVCRVRTAGKITGISGIDADKVKRPEKNVVEFPTEVGGVYVLKP